jgi:hypothetical protein
LHLTKESIKPEILLFRKEWLANWLCQSSRQWCLDRSVSAAKAMQVQPKSWPNRRFPPDYEISCENSFSLFVRRG